MYVSNLMKKTMAKALKKRASKQLYLDISDDVDPLKKRKCFA